MTTSFRRYGRTVEACAVQLRNDEIGEVIAEIRDFSETGVFVKSRELAGKIDIGDAMQAKSNTLSNELTVVRLTEDGVGCAFK